MPHPLVIQFRFARSKFKRALAGLSDADARRRFLPMNCISWNIGHLASAEQSFWLTSMQGQTLLPQLDDLYGHGRPASTPLLAEVLDTWQTVTESADKFLDILTPQLLFKQTGEASDDSQPPQTIGSVLLRFIYHYWYHTGETMAIRQLLGHTNLPEFVGDLEAEAPYLPY